jgi:two-component system, sensor histidine kinase LadS
MRFLILFSFFINFGLYAQDLVYDPLKSKGQLYEYANFYDAGQLSLTLEEVANDTLFENNVLNSENHSVGFTANHYWVRFKINNSASQASTYYLETARPVTDVANLYQISEQGVEQFKSGDKIPFKERQVQHRATVFKLQLPANSTQQIYLHFKSDGETLNIPLNLYTEKSFWMMNYRQQLFLGLFYGVLFLAGVIYLFFYTSLKEKSFLYYGFYVFSIGFMQSALDGFIFEFILPQGGYINSRAVLITALFSTFFLLKYCEHFLKIDTNLKGFKKAYTTIYYILLALFILLFLSPKTLEIAYPLSNLNGLFTLLLILFSVFMIGYKRIAIDKYFSIGIFFLVIGLLGFVLNNLSLLPNNFFTLNSAKFGSGLEVVFLSLSMTNLIRKLRIEKETSQELALQKSEEISNLKTYFMSNMSHELRTPINAIMGIAENELANKGNDVSRKQFEMIKNASLSLLSNVNDIIDFEKIEKNELKLNFEIFKPTTLLQQLSENWSAEAHKKGLDFKFEMGKDIPAKVHGDAERFIQIVNNVLSNAVKFTKQGYVGFRINCVFEPKDICRFSFEIIDTGKGIDAKNQDSIFDSFSQMKLNHQREFGGIGLGLTIVKHLVNLFGGTIALESKPNFGTKILIELPLKYIQDAKEDKNESQQSDSAIKPGNLLVVEDNKLNQMVMAKILGSFSKYTFAMVENGQEALDALQKENYNLILMDLQMPVMDGYEATKIIRSGELGEQISAIPIIAITADAMQETRQRVLDLGMNDYMTKPVNKDLLLDKIKACLSLVEVH